MDLMAWTLIGNTQLTEAACLRIRLKLTRPCIFNRHAESYLIHPQLNFIALLNELKNALTPNGWLLTGAVSAGKNTIDSAYDIKALDRYVCKAQVYAIF